MIVCDRAYLREELKSRMKAARQLLPKDVAATIDAEIEAIEAQGDPWYGTRVMAVAFRLPIQSLRSRVAPSTAFQGNLRKNGPYNYGTWFDACGVNKDTRGYRTWVSPNDAIQALRIAHRIIRYEAQKLRNRVNSQKYIDKRRLQHVNQASEASNAPVPE